MAVRPEPLIADVLEAADQVAADLVRLQAVARGTPIEKEVLRIGDSLSGWAKLMRELLDEL